MAKIAIIGGGISGLGAAYLLNPLHDVIVYEKEARPGGHARTVTVRHGDTDIPVDTGFIVFNRENYPHFSAMLRHLDVRAEKSNMTFAATIRDGWLEWGAQDLNTIFGQRRNLFRPEFYGICRDVLRFNAGARRVTDETPGLTLGDLVARLRLGTPFLRYYLLPMAGAIWSAPFARMLEFPADSFVRFFENHGLLAVDGQPQWYTIGGGSRNYVDRLTAPFAERIRKGCAVKEVQRMQGRVMVTAEDGGTESFDHVVFGCHADEALAMLSDADQAEHETVGAFRYQVNHAVLHKDSSVMPRRRRCWASWIYNSDGAIDNSAISVSYWMNRLQNIDTRYPLFVTLNSRKAIAEEHVFDRHTFMHPVFNSAAIAAQARVQAMQGRRNTWFCGAWLRNGFHEDGLWSAVNVAAALGATVPWSTRPQAGEVVRLPRPVPATTPYPAPKPAYAAAFSAPEA